jgi:hypothetical protein
MKKILSALALLGVCTLAQAGTNIGVVVDINQPGVYGRVELGNRPPPPVIYQQPVIITQPVIVAQQPVYVQPAPLYLKVPPGHSKKWAKHCYKYNACGQPVYFVQYDDYGRGKHGKKHKHDHDD